MSVSAEVSQLEEQLQDSLAKLNMLIENRSAWIDGIEGCREAVVLFGQMQEALLTLSEGASKLESDLASARAEIERWSKMHAELSTVERGLRTDCEEKRLALEERAAGLGRARKLVRELTRELSS